MYSTYATGRTYKTQLNASNYLKIKIWESATWVKVVNSRHCAQGRKNQEIDFSGGGRDCGDWINEVKNIEKMKFSGVGGIANLGAMAVVYGNMKDLDVADAHVIVTAQ